MGAFADAVEAGCNDFLTTVRRTAEIIVEMVGDELIETSPVGRPETWKRSPPADYRPGAFKSNWRLTLDGVDATFDPNRTGSFFVSGLDKLPADPFGHRFVFSNAAPYAWRIEKEAWAIEARGGVIGPVSLEFNRIVSAASAEARSQAGKGAREL